MLGLPRECVDGSTPFLGLAGARRAFCCTAPSLHDVHGRRHPAGAERVATARGCRRSITENGRAVESETAVVAVDATRGQLQMLPTCRQSTDSNDSLSLSGLVPVTPVENRLLSPTIRREPTTRTDVKVASRRVGGPTSAIRVRCVSSGAPVSSVAYPGGMSARPVDVASRRRELQGGPKGGAPAWDFSPPYEGPTALPGGAGAGHGARGERRSHVYVRILDRSAGVAACSSAPLC